MQTQRKPEELSEDERQQLHQAHQRLRNASSALEALTVVAPVRGRWQANPTPPDVLAAAQHELRDAYEQVWQVQDGLLNAAPTDGADDTGGTGR